MHSRPLSESIGHFGQNRQALLSAWESAVQSACGPVAAKEYIHATLYALLDQILEGLLESSPSQAGFSVGRQLAARTCRRRELLGQTTLLLASHLQPDLPPAAQQPFQL